MSFKSPAAPNTPYFTPAQKTPAGAALSANPPTLFTPIKIRDVTFQNRIWVCDSLAVSQEIAK